MYVKNMPVMFVGHGSPMHALEESIFSEGWQNISCSIPKPQAILAISAHWSTLGTQINNSQYPHQIYDMYGFPPELYEITYHAPGSPILAQKAMYLIQKEIPRKKVEINNTWGIDHGLWTVLRRLYPLADVPVVALSVESNITPREAFQIGVSLQPLRKENILILASGSIVHNLSQALWDKRDGFSQAADFDHYIRDAIIQHDIEKILQYKSNPQIKELANYAVPTEEHFIPLLYALGASGDYDTVTVFNDACTLGSISMTSYLFH